MWFQVFLRFVLLGVFFGGFLAAGGLVVSSSNGNCGVRRGKLMKKIVDWEWVIETHPDFDEDIDDLIHADSIEKINHYLALVDDPVEVAIQKMEWNEEGNLLRRTYFYVNFSDKTLRVLLMRGVEFLLGFKKS